MLDFNDKVFSCWPSFLFHVTARFRVWEWIAIKTDFDVKIWSLFTLYEFYLDAFVHYYQKGCNNFPVYITSEHLWVFPIFCLPFCHVVNWIKITSLPLTVYRWCCKRFELLHIMELELKYKRHYENCNHVPHYHCLISVPFNI